jgi:hypothetical protein
LNYRSFFLVFSLTDAVVDPIAEGGGVETNWVLTDRNRRFGPMFRFYGPIKALSTKPGRCQRRPKVVPTHGFFMIVNSSRRRF